MRSDSVKTGVQQAPHRSLFNALGITEEERQRPLIGIVSSYNEIVPGHMNLDKIVEAVKMGVAMAGGTPIVFPAIAVCDGIAMGHVGMKYSLVTRDLIADSVVGVIAQRLVRRVCPACGIVREATAGEKKILGIKDPARRINVRTPGHKECVRCGGTGYYGRIGIYEIMPVTADLRQAINRGENADVLEEIALTHGMKTLRMSAIDYALRGITTVEEVQRVAYDDEED